MTTITTSMKTALLALALGASFGLLLGVVPAAARNPNAENLYSVRNLQSDVPGAAEMTDPDLVNGWGISHSSTGPWWVSDEGTDKSTLYDGNTGMKLGLVVAVAGGPTGQAFNSFLTSSPNDFKVDAGTGLLPSVFIFATETGSIYGWNGVGTVAIQGVATPDAIYLGLAIGSVGSANYLYAANFHTGAVDVFNGE